MPYQAISTKYLGPTTYKGARIKAQAAGGESITRGYNYALSSIAAHAAVARELAERLKWDGFWVAGDTGGAGYVFVHAGKSASSQGVTAESFRVEPAPEFWTVRVRPSGALGEPCEAIYAAKSADAAVKAACRDGYENMGAPRACANGERIRPAASESLRSHAGLPMGGGERVHVRGEVRYVDNYSPGARQVYVRDTAKRGGAVTGPFTPAECGLTVGR